jgi:hypothetical protein
MRAVLPPYGKLIQLVEQHLDSNITAFNTLITNLSWGSATMGVKTTLAGVTLTAGDITQAERLGLMPRACWPSRRLSAMT